METPKADAALRWVGGNAPSTIVDEMRRMERENARLASALRILIERHEDEVNGGAPITGEEWEIASYALPRIDSDA
jgi:hypothetical protein